MKKILILLILPLLANAEVYRCNSGGGVVFSDKPCDDNAETVKINSGKTGVALGPAGIVCASGVSAVVENLHFPNISDPQEAKRRVEADLNSHHLRKAIQKADPKGVMPAQVSKVRATAVSADKVRGFSKGTVVRAEVCK